ncbi:hypothetical protein [Tautonia sociabilis]|uniref:hypothetical protein n=1 Tax=Tautonia sociabilis TaxID=2080755 RepID=UPI0013155BEC|nr:hypothetical protein [Tautonia sociabilis]
MRDNRRCSLALVLLAALGVIPVLPGCGEEEAPPVEVDQIDFEEAQKEATKEYGGQ